MDVAAALEQRIREQHGARSVLQGTTYVAEKVDGQRPWLGLVYLFDVEGHPTATRCYGLASLGDDGRVELSAILHDNAVQSPQAAVRAYLVSRLAGPPGPGAGEGAGLPQ